MKNLWAVVGVVVAVVALVAGAVYWFVFREPRALRASSNGATAIPKKKTKCDPAVMDAEVASAVQSGQSGAQETGHPAGGAAGAAPAVLRMATSPCAAEFEKKLRAQMEAGVKGAKEAFKQFGRESRKTGDKLVLGSQRRSATKKAKKVGKKAKNLVGL